MKGKAFARRLSHVPSGVDRLCRQRNRTHLRGTTLRECDAVESMLDTAGIDYTVQVESIERELQSAMSIATFYVLSGGPIR
jgi:hypothetical protein